MVPHARVAFIVAKSPLVTNITFKQNGTTRMTTSKSYDLLNRLTRISSSSSSSFSSSFDYAYNAANQRTAVTNADNSRWAYGYDSLGQVTSGKKYWSDSSAVAGQQFDYTFDTIGNRKTATRDTRQSDYTVNTVNQYTQRTVPGYVNVIGEATNAATVSVNYTVASRKGDYFRAEVLVSNSAPLWQGLTNLAVLNQGTNSDIISTNLGRMLIPQTPEAFTYDADGNLTSDSLWTNTWNAENRRITIESRSGVPTAGKIREDWTYLPDGRWVERIVSTWNSSTLNYQPSTTNRYIWDGNVLLAVLNHTNGLELAFMRGLDLSGTLQGAGGVGGLLAVVVGPAVPIAPLANTAHFACFDGNGNVTALVNSADGTESARYEYGPFNEPLRITGVMGKANPIRFSTQYADDFTGDLKYLYRDLSDGRWQSRDPIDESGGENLYAFVNNNPIDQADYLGHYALYDALDGAVSDYYFRAKAFTDYLWQKIPYGSRTREILRLTSTGMGLPEFKVRIYRFKSINQPILKDRCCIGLRIEGGQELNPASDFVTHAIPRIVGVIGGAKKLLPQGKVTVTGEGITIEDCKHYTSRSQMHFKGSLGITAWLGYSADLKLAEGSVGVKVQAELTPSFNQIGDAKQVVLRVNGGATVEGEVGALDESVKNELGPTGALWLQVYPSVRVLDVADTKH